MNGNDLLKPEYIWILLGLALLISEFAIPGLVVFFFGLGAMLVGAACFLVDLTLNAQIFLFIASSVGMLVALRDTLTNLLQGKQPDDGSEDAADVIGERAKVTRTISPEESGNVEFHGSQWRAKSEEEIAAGATVEVIGRDNLTLVVKPVEHV